jgi:ATP phosphoribosyltransferase
MTENLRLAVQKSGRLHEESVKLLRECGIDLNNEVNRLRTQAANFPLELLFLRDDDIPQYVADGVADIGIAGENVVAEKDRSVLILEKLGFGKCRLSIAVPKNAEYTGVASLQGRRIATSYPHLLQTFLNSNNVTAEIHEISGSVEIAPGIGLADAICDLVSTGSTLFLNNLRETEVVLQSQAVLIQHNTLSPVRAGLLNRLQFRIQAVKKAKRNKYILLNAPNEKLEAICSLLPGIKSPTILPLAQKGWSSLHSVVQEDDFWNIIEKLKQEGAEGILILPVEKMIV